MRSIFLLLVVGGPSSASRPLAEVLQIVRDRHICGAATSNRGIKSTAAAIVALPLAARSQVVAPSQVTPETLRPTAPSAPAPPQIPGAEPLQAPAGAEKLSFIVGRVTIEGAFPEFDSETRAFIHAVQGHRITVARIYELANAMEQAYARAGYVLARVTVPEQNLNDHGPLRIVVIDGFVEKVQVDNVPERVRALVAARMASLIGRRHIKLTEIERRLLISGDVPGLRLVTVLPFRPLAHTWCAVRRVR